MPAIALVSAVVMVLAGLVAAGYVDQLNSRQKADELTVQARILAGMAKPHRNITVVGDDYDEILAADISPDQSHAALGGPSKVLQIYALDSGSLSGTWTAATYGEWTAGSVPHTLFRGERSRRRWRVSRP